MMKSKELCEHAKGFLTVPTFYEYGGWGQTMTAKELERLASLYPKNKPINYDNVGKWGFDCICFIKGLMSGVTSNHHVDDYKELKANPIGDCTNKQFKEMLTDCVPAGIDVPEGYGLATDDHAGLSLGEGWWIDANRKSGQDGVMKHFGIPSDFKCGKIPGVDYEEEKDEVQDFLSWLYRKWKEGGTL